MSGNFRRSQEIAPGSSAVAIVEVRVDERRLWETHQDIPSVRLSACSFARLLSLASGRTPGSLGYTYARARQSHTGDSRRSGVMCLLRVYWQIGERVRIRCSRRSSRNTNGIVSATLSRPTYGYRLSLRGWPPRRRDGCRFGGRVCPQETLNSIE